MKIEKVEITKCENGYMAYYQVPRFDFPGNGDTTGTIPATRIFESSAALFAWLREQFGEGEDQPVVDEPYSCGQTPCVCQGGRCNRTLQRR